MSLPKHTQLQGKGYPHYPKSKKANAAGNSINGAKHPYLRRDFWANPLNHFWESASYNPKFRDYYRGLVL